MDLHRDTVVTIAEERTGTAGQADFQQSALELLE